jgi:anti-sigma factor RsiW
MVNHLVLADHKLQDYIDGRLNERDQAAVAAYLRVHPDVAAEVEMLRRQNEALKGIGQEILEEPVPPRLRDVVYRHTAPPPAAGRGGRDKTARASSFLEAAAAILLFCAGGALGWFLHDQFTSRPGVQDAIASNAADLYRFYGGEHPYPVDFPPDRTAELTSWIKRSFDREISPPDLGELSYEYQGGEVLSFSGESIGFFRFESPEGARLAVVFWPGEQPPTKVESMGRHQNVAARYWLGDGLSFAVMSDDSNPDLENAAQAVFSFYGGDLASSSP